MSKADIFSLIEQGYNNTQIAIKASCSNGHVRNMRQEFNKVSAVKTHSKKQKLEKPKPGTDLRIAYDFYRANPGISTYKAMQATGLSSGTVCLCHKRYIKGAVA